MTPFGEKVREYRTSKSILLKDMARDLGVSSAYFSALERGKRGRPGIGLVQQICGYLDLIWDDAEELKYLANLSHPRVTVDTSLLSARATYLANLLAEAIKGLDDQTIEWIIAEINVHKTTLKGPRY